MMPDVTLHGPDKEPKTTIIGGIHGDEPAGVEAVRYLRNCQFDHPIQLVIANPEAVRKSRRYNMVDLNRAYPGDKDGKKEERIAAELLDVIEGTVTLSIHSTHSTDTPFIISSEQSTEIKNIVNKLPIKYHVDPSPLGDVGLSQYPNVIEVECGCQLTQNAKRNATDFSKQFIKARQNSKSSSDSTIEKFEMYEVVKKPTNVENRSCAELYEFCAENFSKVEKGDVYAKYNDIPLRAESSFYPILMSSCGYSDIFGYKSRRQK